MPQADLPLISIVTPSLNRVTMIRRAVDSVRAQSVPAEHIIVDGQSSDGTLQLLSQFPDLSVISEPDENVYDAWNKGISRARGKYIGFLNSDDWLEPDSLQDVVRAFSENPSAQVVSGGAKHVMATTSEVMKTIYSEDSLEKIATTVWSACYAPNINARFFEKAIFDKFGLFDHRQFPLSADRDFLFRIILGGIVHISVDRLVYSYVNHQDSKTLHGDWRKGRESHIESVAIAEKHLNAKEMSPEERQVLERWRDECAIKAAASTLLKGELATGFEMLREGPLHRPNWPKTLTHVAARALQRKVRRLF